MVFGGLQKLSLIDFPEKVSAVVFTQGCLFRCRYCHNPELVPVIRQGAIEASGILSYLKAKCNFLDGVCITGGEPTVHAGLPDFIKKIKNLGLLVKLDTSGINPWMVEHLLKLGLIDYIAMDIKQQWDKYNEIVRTANPRRLKNCQKTMRLIQGSGIDHEFRTTILPESHQLNDFFKIVALLRPGEKYFVQDISFTKNLDAAIDKTKNFNTGALVNKLRSDFPDIQIEVR